MSIPLIILNPGHYPGKDPGACSGGLQEAEVNVRICDRIAALATRYGFYTMTVHENELADICRKANAYADAVLFYSVHVNAGGGTGYEDYTYSQSSNANVYRDIIRAEVMAYLDGFGFVDRGAKYNSSLYVLRNTSMPAVLTENLFIDTEKDALKLTSPAFLDGLALAHVKGLARALGANYGAAAEPGPEWAQGAVEWAVKNGLVDTREGSEDFYRQVVILHRYHNKFNSA